ncbi:MAG TPA: hypothetical protein VK559_04000 [Ferruginibacter sp.]|nr:hypothetical protein [Ferruginibacter sp.]
MIRFLLLFTIIIFSNDCFSQNAAALGHVHGFIYFPPQTFSQNNIKKEICYSLYTDSGKIDSSMYKILFYDSLGNVKEEIEMEPANYPDSATISDTTIYYYNLQHQGIKEVTNGNTADEDENEYDEYGNRIKRYYKMNNKIMSSFIDSFNTKQQLIKYTNIINLQNIDTLRTEWYYYNIDGKIDSIVTSAKKEKYTQLGQYNKNDDTTVLYRKDKFEIIRCFYNDKKQLVKKVSTVTANGITDIYNNKKNLLSVQTDIFSYNANGTIYSEETEIKFTVDTKLISNDHTIYHHYYFQ